MSEHRYCKRIDAVFELISSQAPTQFASRYIEQDVVLKMDGMAARGVEHWCTWVEYMRRFSRVTNLTLQRGETVVGDNHVEVRGVAFGDLKDSQRIEHPIFVKFFFSGEKIKEIHTTRFNYVVPFGEKIKNKFIFYLLIMRMLIWKRLRKR